MKPGPWFPNKTTPAIVAVEQEFRAAGLVTPVAGYERVYPLTRGLESTERKGHAVEPVDMRALANRFEIEFATLHY